MKKKYDAPEMLIAQYTVNESMANNESIWSEGQEKDGAIFDLGLG